MDESDILMAQWAAEEHRPAHAFLVDRNAGKIVVSIRWECSMSESVGVKYEWRCWSAVFLEVWECSMNIRWEFTLSGGADGMSWATCEVVGHDLIHDHHTWS